MSRRPGGLMGEPLLAALEAEGRTFACPAEMAAIFDGRDIKSIYAGLERGEIPYTRIGQRYSIPVAWIRRQVDGLDQPEPARQSGTAA